VATDPTQPPGEPLAGGRLHAAISNAAVRIHREFLGRGPDRARTTIAENLVVILLQDTLTKAEQSLIAAGRHEDVLCVRQTFQQTIRTEVVHAVEQLTGRTVAAFMSANHIDPDLACEILVLSPEPPPPHDVGEPGPEPPAGRVP
jgi:uncharacterized protein YbcI